MSDIEEKVYFSKIEFKEFIGGSLESILLLNLVDGTLAYQVYECNERMYAPAIEGIETEEIMGHIWEFKIRKPAMKMRNGKTGFQPVLLVNDIDRKKIVFSYTHKFSEDEIKGLLPFCNALDFVPYREREMSMDDEGYCGYRDEQSLYFTGITDSYIPRIDLPMNYYYDEKHIWPSEKLYRYIVINFLNDKKMKNWVVSYGGLSLFI